MIFHNNLFKLLAGAIWLLWYIHIRKKLYWNKPFQRAAIFQKAYLTDMIQELVDIGIKVHCVIIERGWKEIDTVEDYQKALKEFNE